MSRANVDRVGIDTGGTFCDLVASDGTVVKVPSTPDDPARAVRAALATLGRAPAEVAHGTTVATNALLERRYGSVALVTNEGFEDVVEIARQARPSLYDPSIVRPDPVVSRSARFGIGGRVDASGRELEAIDPSDVESLVERLSAGSFASVAVSFLHSDLHPNHEQAVARVLRARGFDVTCSHEVSPEHREYERTITTVVNAALRPVCREYLGRLHSIAERVSVMTSDAGLIDLAAGGDLPAALLLSGPAGGLLAAAAVARSCGCLDAVTFDMGGTSTDVGLVLDGRPEPASQREVAGLPIRLPSLAIHTIGAGGGSIAAIDAGGALVVGPRSAGARPGPAAYGLGGVEPTVTDADLCLGRIPADHGFPGLGHLDLDAARAALDRHGVDAEGVVSVVDTAMANAVRVMTVERGFDPRAFALVAFGGAGPLHACAVAEAIGIGRVIVPPRAGVLSAVGLLCAPRAREVVRSVGRRELDEVVAEAASAARAAIGAPSASDTVVDIAFDCRYEGQSHELTVGAVEQFGATHRRSNGFELDRVVEVVAVRARASSSAPMNIDRLGPVDRRTQRGPAVAIEPDCTMYVPDGWSARVGPLGSWIVEPT